MLNEIKNQKTNFSKYSFIGLFITIIKIIMLYIMIDILGISTIVSSTIVVGGLFIIKFILYIKTGLIQ